jgi:hypothetical protein
MFGSTKNRLKPLNDANFLSVFVYVQAALVIPGFAIRGFDYPRFIICSQALLFAVFPLIICGFSLDYSRFLI